MFLALAYQIPGVPSWAFLAVFPVVTRGSQDLTITLRNFHDARIKVGAMGGNAHLVVVAVAVVARAL